MNCLFSGAIARIGGAQKRAGGVASAKYSQKRVKEGTIMKKRKEKIAICLAGVIVIAGMLSNIHEVRADGNYDSIIPIKESVEYIPNTELEQSEKIDEVFGISAPTRDGYLFGGWYQEVNDKKNQLKRQNRKKLQQEQFMQNLFRHM